MTSKQPLTTRERAENLNKLAISHMAWRGVDAVTALKYIAENEAMYLGVRASFQDDAKIILHHVESGEPITCWLVPVEGVKSPSIEAGTIGFELGDSFAYICESDF